MDIPVLAGRASTKPPGHGKRDRDLAGESKMVFAETVRSGQVMIGSALRGPVARRRSLSDVHHNDLTTPDPGCTCRRRITASYLVEGQVGTGTRGTDGAGARVLRELDPSVRSTWARWPR